MPRSGPSSPRYSAFSSARAGHSASRRCRSFPPRPTSSAPAASPSISVVAGIALWLARRRARLMPLYAAALLGTALITSALFFNGHRHDDTELLYMWVDLVCFYFFTWRAAPVQVA